MAYFEATLMDAAHRIPDARKTGRTVTILLVEDEVLVRTVLAEDLRDRGYTIIEATDANEALSILQSNTEVDLVITDKRMPGSLDGLGLARLIRRDFPQIALIMISGEAPHADVFEVLDGYLRKPCRLNELLSQVRGLTNTDA